MKIKSYNKFILNEDFNENEDFGDPKEAIEDTELFGSEIDADNIEGDITLYRLTSHHIVNLSEPGEYYVKSIEDINPDLLENRESDELFLITVTCPESNIDIDASEIECVKFDCDSIIAVKDDAACEIVSVEPYKEI